MTSDKRMPRSLREKLRFLLNKSSDAAQVSSAARPRTLETTAFSTCADFFAYYRSMGASYKAQEQYLLELIKDNAPFAFPGYCFTCRSDVRFMVDYLYSHLDPATGLQIPNWRERVTCPHCGLNSRVRAAVQFVQETLACEPDASIYITEQTTPLYRYLHSRYPNLVGSEYLGEQLNYGETNAHSGIRNESITKLSFADESFDFVLSFDVFEHVPEYRKALHECLRVLKPGGRLVFTVPFRLDHESNLVRATLDRDGKVVLLMEPEYHGDPVNNAGCLCFYHFGWQLLDELKHCGFSSAAAHLYWSDTLGYLGQHQLLFCAAKPSKPGF